MCASRTRAALSLAKVTGSQRPHARGDLQLLSTCGSGTYGQQSDTTERVTSVCP
jgi:hypothetical protein